MAQVTLDPGTINGEGFSRAIRAGALAVVREQESLNRINVFPVPDGDTGANLAATLKAAASRLGTAAPVAVGEAARVAADGALDGARGNSGAIFAQFLYGVASSLERLRQADGPQFAAAALRGTESAYSALQEPREGTILSVLTAWAHELSRRANEEDLPQLMGSGLAAAREALAATPRQLEVLARSHVVDAGAQGFVFFLEGLIDSLRGNDEPDWAPVEAPVRGLPLLSDAHDEIDDRFRFCTEALLAPGDGAPLSRDIAMARLTGLGESLVVAGGETRLRVHAHTNEPQRFLAAVAELGIVEHTKIDDMVQQQLACRTSSIALVTDSTTDLPEDDIFRLGLFAVPLTLTLGDEEFLDGVDITLDGFIQRIVAGTAVPRSSQPAVSDFVQTYRRLMDCREGVVSVHAAGAISGTVQAARTAAREVDPARVRVIDSCSVSVGAGLLVEAVGAAIESGADLDEVERVAERVRREIQIFGALSSLDFAVRGGRLSPFMARTLDRLHLVPVIVFDRTGRAGKSGVALGFRRGLNALVRRAVRVAGGGPARAMVVHCGDVAAGELVAARLRERLGGDVPVVRAGAVLTTHTGLGAVFVAVRPLHSH